MDTVYSILAEEAGLDGGPLGSCSCTGYRTSFLSFSFLIKPTDVAISSALAA